MEEQDLIMEEVQQEAPKKKKRHIPSWLIGFLVGIVVTSLVVTGVRVVKQLTSKEYIVETLIDRYFLNEVDDAAVEEGKYAGMIAALEDPYSEYLTEDATAAKVQNSEGHYRGIGAVFSQDVETKEMTVARCYPDSPAEKAGLLPGDVLYQIDGEDVTDMELEDAVAIIKGSGDEGVTLTMIREGSTVEFHMVTAEVTYPVTDIEMLEDGVGYLAIYEFKETTFAQFSEGLAELKEQGMTRLIVDLRNNTGGLLNSVTDILNSILPEGTIVYMKDKQGNRSDCVSKGETPLEIPMVVLVNGYTASAAEIFAGAVRDYDMAQLVGTNTFGKGVVQNTFFLTDGTAVKLTVANYYTPNGTNIHGTGLAPDVEVELNTEPDEDGYIYDNQLEKAIEIVKEME